MRWQQLELEPCIASVQRVGEAVQNCREVLHEVAPFPCCRRVQKCRVDDDEERQPLHSVHAANSKRRDNSTRDACAHRLDFVLSSIAPNNSLRRGREAE
jgi:hypothetical protein